MAVLAIAAHLFSAGVAHAAPGCSSLSVTGMAFGVYDPFSPVHLDSVAYVTYNCPPPTSPLVTLSSGSAQSFQPRYMTSGSYVLLYNLYADAARTQIWGDGSNGTVTMQGSGGAKQTLPIYGRIFAAQDPAVGTYADSIIVTLHF